MENQSQKEITTNHYVINPASKNMFAFSRKEEINTFINNCQHKFSEETKFKRQEIKREDLKKYQKLGYKLNLTNPYPKDTLQQMEKTKQKINDRIDSNKEYIQFTPKNDKNTLGVIVEFQNDEEKKTYQKNSTIIKEGTVLNKKNSNDREKIFSAFKTGNIMQSKEGYNIGMSQQTDIMVNSTIKNWRDMNPHYNSFIMIASKVGDKIKSPLIIKTRPHLKNKVLAGFQNESEKNSIVTKNITALSPITISHVSSNIQVNLVNNPNNETIKSVIQAQKDMRLITIQDEKQKEATNQKTNSPQKQTHKQGLKQ